MMSEFRGARLGRVRGALGVDPSYPGGEERVQEVPASTAGAPFHFGRKF
jgi:hypothetical protein